MVIILDGINNLSLKYHDLHWLPQELPPNVYIIVSSTPEAIVMETVKARSGGVISTEVSGAEQQGWLHIPIQPLEHEKEQILDEILKKNGKELAKSALENIDLLFFIYRKQILSHPCSELPLFITTVLNEMYNTKEKLSEQLELFLHYSDLTKVFTILLSSWEVCTL